MIDSRLRLKLVGRFDVEGEVEATVPGGRAAKLLKILAVHQGRFVSVATLIELLWDGQAPERPDRNIAALVSRLRRCVGTARIDGDSRGYSLARDESTLVDLGEAEQLVCTGEQELNSGHNAYAAVAAEQAVRILTGGEPLADEPGSPWVDDVREFTNRLTKRARSLRWRSALELGDFPVAVTAATEALIADPLDEAAVRALMQAHAATGEQAAALRVYESLRRRTSDELGTDPSAETHALFVNLLRDPESAVSHTRADAAGAESKLVGRRHELDVLRGRWADAVRRDGGIVVVRGEAGIGKTALVSALAEEAGRVGALVVGTSCFEAERSLYLQPLLEAVAAIADRFDAATVREFAGDSVGTLMQLVPQLGRMLGPVAYTRAGSEIEHRRNLEGLTAFFANVAERQPVQLTVEDMQHAGQSTVEALHFLASRLVGRRMLVVATERTGDMASGITQLTDIAQVVRLGRLSEEDVKQLVVASHLPYDVAEFYDWTGGSPLFAAELIRHGRHSGRRGKAQLDIPASLQDAVSVRVVASGDEATSLLQQGAILGSSFSLDDVAALAGMDVEDCARAAGRALRAGLLVDRGDVFSFANDVVRKVVYDSMPKPIRVSRHRRAAKLLDDRPEAAAHQFVGAQDWGPAAAQWRRAAENAHLDFANVDAERLLGNALACAESAGDRRMRAEIGLRRAQVRDDLGHLSDAKDDCEAVLAVARNLGDENLEALALEQLGWTALYARDSMTATDLAARATHIAESAAAAAAARPSSLLLLGRVRHWDGDYAGATAAYGQVLEGESDDSTAAMVLAYRGALLQHMDRFAEARTVLARAAALSRRSGEFRLLLQTLFFTGLARGDVGDFDGALRALGRALKMIDEYGVNYYRAGIYTTISWLWREIGDLGRAREHAEQAIELAHRGGGALELEQELHALLALADCELEAGRDDAAGVLVEQAAPLLDRSLPFRPRARMRLFEMQARWDRARAEGLLDEARTHSSTKYEALALHHLGRAGEAAGKALSTGSDLLIAQLGPAADRRAALDRIAAPLPGDLKQLFTRGGRLLSEPKILG